MRMLRLYSGLLKLYLGACELVEYFLIRRGERRDHFRQNWVGGSFVGLVSRGASFRAQGKTRLRMATEASPRMTASDQWLAFFLLFVWISWPRTVLVEFRVRFLVQFVGLSASLKLLGEKYARDVRRIPVVAGTIATADLETLGNSSIAYGHLWAPAS